MIPEIGILIGLYALVRLVPEKWKVLTIILSIITAVVSVLVIVDLGIRGFSDRGLVSYLQYAAQEETPSPKDEDQREPSRATINVSRDNGGSITTQLGYGIAVAKGSSLHREWISVHDSAFPADLQGTPGVTTVYTGSGYSGEYRYRADFELLTRQDIRAVEVRFLTFDVWGNHTQSLSYEEVADIPAKEKRKLRGEWRIFSENDVERHYASIGYIAKVRLANGRVLEARSEPVLDEARKFTEKFTAADLEPGSKPDKGGGSPEKPKEP